MGLIGWRVFISMQEILWVKQMKCITWISLSMTRLKFIKSWGAQIGWIVRVFYPGWKCQTKRASLQMGGGVLFHREYRVPGIQQLSHTFCTLAVQALIYSRYFCNALDKREVEIAFNRQFDVRLGKYKGLWNYRLGVPGALTWVTSCNLQLHIGWGEVPH